LCPGGAGKSPAIGDKMHGTGCREKDVSASGLPVKSKTFCLTVIHSVTFL
jgi:hypothetical protein